MILAPGGEEPAKGQIAQPGGDRRVSRRHAEQAVPGANRVGAVVADPGLELLDERRVRQLGGVALNHVFQHPLHGRALGQQQHANTLRRAGTFEQGQLLAGQRFAVVIAPCALPRGDRHRQGVGAGCRGCQRHTDGVARRVEAGLGVEPVRRCSLDEVFSGASQRHEDMVVIRVHRRTTPRQVGQDRDRCVVDRELPALGVVARRCQRCAADEFLAQRRAFDADRRVGAPGSCGGGLVTLGISALRARRQDRCPAEKRRCARDEPPSRNDRHRGPDLQILRVNHGG